MTREQAATSGPAASKLMQAMTRLSELSSAYVASQAFFAACELDVFEKLAAVPASAEDLAAQLGIHPVGCRRLLMALVQLDLIECEGDLYRNSEMGQFCTSASEANLAALSGWNAPFFHMSEFLPDALREYSPRWEQALGTPQRDVFAALYEDPGRLRRFALFMNASSIPQGQLIAESFDFGRYTSIMDVAGGPGGQAIQIGVRHPHLKGVITDMLPVCEVATEYIQQSGLADRFQAIPADLFEGPYPKGSDVIIIGHILHDWGDEACLRILRNCFDALPEEPDKGVLLISESVLEPDHSGSILDLTKDLTMLLACDPGARERNEAEYRSLLNQTGFDIEQVIRMEAPRDLIVARKR